MGTLLAITFYFRDEWVSMLGEVPRVVTGNLAISKSRLTLLALGTLPGAIAGLLGKDVIETYFRTPQVIAIALILFALILGVAERTAAKIRSADQAKPIDALTIGLFQALALMPGVSRSGITITAALLRGFRSNDAARLSFILSAPLMIAAGLLESVDAYREYAKGPLSSDPLMHLRNAPLLVCAGTLASAIAGFLCIRYFLRYLRSGGMMPFIIYRVALGIILLSAIAYGMGGVPADLSARLRFSDAFRTP
jgi:undecaprenyl-diphosphatase